MKKRMTRKLKLASETLQRLDGIEIRKARGGQDYQCGPDSFGFSGADITYCATQYCPDYSFGCSGNSACP